MTDRARRILGVSADADDREVREAYRRLVKRAHPDLNPDDPQAAGRFHDIQTAFRQLTDAEPPADDSQPSRKTPPDPRPKPTRSSPGRRPRSTLGVIWWLPVVIAVAILVVVAAVSDDDGSTQPIPSPEVCVRIVDPVTGDGEPIECSTPHEISIYHSGIITGFSGSYPGDDELAEATLAICDRSFRSLMGEGPTTAGYVVRARVPDSGEWTAGERRYDCLAAHTNGELIEGPLAPGG